MKIIILSLLTVFLFSCAVKKRDHTYWRPVDRIASLSNFIELDKSYDDVWLALTEYSATNIFAINIYDKASGLLTADFSAVAARTYVDCGTVQFSSYGLRSSYLKEVSRADLSGAYNIYVKSIGENKTRLTINARYILDIKDGNLPVVSLSFDTTTLSGQKIRNFHIFCWPTLTLEKNILDGIKHTASLLSIKE